MRITKFCFVLLCLTLICSPLSAEIAAFQSNENSGLNKKERIDALEKYLADLSGLLKKMEDKTDENSKKIQNLFEIVKAIKEVQDKKAEAALGEKKAPSAKEALEIERLKADILALKNQDIEKLKNDVQDLNDTLKIIKNQISIK